MDEHHESSGTPDSGGAPDPVERHLARLTLRAPSGELDRRVAAMFDAAAEPVASAVADVQPPASAAAPAVIGRIVRVGFAVAACLVVGVTIFLTTGPRPQQNPDAPIAPHAAAAPDDAVQITPVRFDQTLTDAVPGEVVIVDDRLPVVPIQQNAIQRTRWVDPHTNTQIEMTVPRQQTLIVPVQVD